ncbi:MAG: GNAT family N-acetyltransferase [Polyangiaceae bacterium]
MSSDSLEIRPLAGESELAELAKIESWAFGPSPDDCAGWLSRAGLPNVRVALRGGRVLGGLLLVPMGQWFGGRSVPMTGVAGVAVAPEARGEGVARQLMARVVRELREQGTAISTLYPATLPLYRHAGYELAGARYQASLTPDRISIRERELVVRELGAADQIAVAELYAERARARNGTLDRGEYIWNRVRSPRNDPARGYGVEADGHLEGYVYVREKQLAAIAYELHLSDFVARTPRAVRRLWAFLGDHRSLAQKIVFHADPSDPLLLELPERGYAVELNHYWMIRVVDSKAALEARGYPKGLVARLELEVRDELLEREPVRLRLRVEAGHASVEAGGTGALALDVRGLAALYSGFASTDTLALRGQLTGDPESRAVADAMFAGPNPHMPDMF